MEILVDTAPIHIKQTSALVIGCYQDESIDDDIFSNEFDLRSKKYFKYIY